VTADLFVPAQDLSVFGQDAPQRFRPRWGRRRQPGRLPMHQHQTVVKAFPVPGLLDQPQEQLGVDTASKSLMKASHLAHEIGSNGEAVPVPDVGDEAQAVPFAPFAKAQQTA
jgi:hypothetical protein